MTPTRFQSTNHSEGGYALVSLLLVMSLLALFALGAAQNIRQQAQREREKEAIFRGEQVADAIRAYYAKHRHSTAVPLLPPETATAEISKTEAAKADAPAAVGSKAGS